MYRENRAAPSVQLNLSFIDSTWDNHFTGQILIDQIQNLIKNIAKFLKGCSCLELGYY